MPRLGPKGKPCVLPPLNSHPWASPSKAGSDQTPPKPANSSNSATAAPPPWFERVDPAHIEAIATDLSATVRLTPPSHDLNRVLAHASHHMPGRSPKDAGTYRGYTEDLPSAIARHHIPTDGDVFVTDTPHDSDQTEPLNYNVSMIRIAMRHAVEFEFFFWGDTHWIIADDRSWLLAGILDCPSAFWPPAHR